jgi:mRNA interferase MazF
VSLYIPSRCDIAWLNFSPQDGHEQAKRRPALVLSATRYNAASGLAVVCPISSRVRQHPFEVVLPEALTTQGVVLADQVRSFDWRARRADFLEHAPEQVLHEVLARLSALLEL